MNSSSLAKWLAIASVCGLALSAIADPPDSSEPVLGGPKVQELGTPGAPRTFDGKAGGMRMATPELPLPRYIAVLNSTLGPSANGSLKLTDAQEEKIRAAEKDFRESQRKYMQANGKQIDEIKKGAKANGPARGKKPAKGENDSKADASGADDAMGADPMKTDSMNADAAAPGAAMEKVRKLREGAPKAAEVQARIWSFLTPEQQAEVKPKLDAALNQISHDRATKEAEKWTERKLKDQALREQQGQAGKPAKPAQAGKRGEKALEKYNQATPEQQAEMRSKLKARLDKMPADQKAKLLEKLKSQGIDPATLEKSGDK